MAGVVAMFRDTPTAVSIAVAGQGPGRRSQAYITQRLSEVLTKAKTDARSVVEFISVRPARLSPGLPPSATS
jgi:hypothetical protein